MKSFSRSFPRSRSFAMTSAKGGVLLVFVGNLSSKLVATLTRSQRHLAACVSMSDNRAKLGQPVLESQTERQTDGLTDRQTDGRIDRRKDLI